MKYIPSIAMGRHYLYRILTPERATLLLRHNAHAWRMESIEAKRNQRVAWSVISSLESWFRLETQKPSCKAGTRSSQAACDALPTAGHWQPKAGDPNPDAYST